MKQGLHFLFLGLISLYLAEEACGAEAEPAGASGTVHRGDELLKAHPIDTSPEARAVEKVIPQSDVDFDTAKALYKEMALSDRDLVLEKVLKIKTPALATEESLFPIFSAFAQMESEDIDSVLSNTLRAFLRKDSSILPHSSMALAKVIRLLSLVDPDEREILADQTCAKITDATSGYMVSAILLEEAASSFAALGLTPASLPKALTETYRTIPVGATQEQRREAILAAIRAPAAATS